MAFQPWQYRTETGLPGEEVDLTGYSMITWQGSDGTASEPDAPE